MARHCQATRMSIVACNDGVCALLCSSYDQSGSHTAINRAEFIQHGGLGITRRESDSMSSAICVEACSLTVLDMRCRREQTRVVI